MSSDNFADAIEHVDDWREHYPTDTIYGMVVPTPADWVFDEYERGGVILSWKRYEDIGHEHTRDHEVVEARDYAKDAGTPDETAMLSPGLDYEAHRTDDGDVERRPVADPADRELSIGATTVFKVYDPIDENELLAATAEILARHTSGEDYSEIVEELEAPDTDGSETLGQWGNDA